jgi:hypothetical protein
MTKKATLVFTILALAACFLSYKVGSVPVALAKGRSAQQDPAGQVAPPLPAPPAEWVLHAVNGTNPASVTKPAGGAGVQHVVDCISATVTTTSSTGNLVDVELLDGSGVQWAQWALPVVPDVNGMGAINLCGLNIVGNTNESMTLTFQANGGSQSVVLIGHEAT